MPASEARDDSAPDIAGVDDKTFKTFLAQTGPPAFIRRAQRVAEAEEALLKRCRTQREEMLSMVRLRLGALAALAGDWQNLGGCTDDAAIAALQALHADLAPPPSPCLAATTSKSALRQALRDLAESIERFNRRWQQLIEQVDLTELNDLRDKYNRYYVLEKECITRSPRLARQGCFTPLPPFTRQELLAAFPLLRST